MIDNMTITEYVHDSLNNAVQNGDDEYIASLETLNNIKRFRPDERDEIIENNINFLFDDMASCDAGIEKALMDAEDQGIEKFIELRNEIKTAIRKWVYPDEPGGYVAELMTDKHPIDEGIIRPSPRISQLQVNYDNKGKVTFSVDALDKITPDEEKNIQEFLKNVANTYRDTLYKRYSYTIDDPAMESDF